MTLSSHRMVVIGDGGSLVNFWRKIIFDNFKLTRWIYGEVRYGFVLMDPKKGEKFLKKGENSASVSFAKNGSKEVAFGSKFPKALINAENLAMSVQIIFWLPKCIWVT